jgi:hypothetical protein
MSLSPYLFFTSLGRFARSEDRCGCRKLMSAHGFSLYLKWTWLPIKPRLGRNNAHLSLVSEPIMMSNRSEFKMWDLEVSQHM